MTSAPPRPTGVTGEAADLAAELTRQLDGEVAFDDYTRHLFSQDASMYTITPAGVVYPRHTADVAAAVRLAGEAGIPVLARGAGTSLAGQTVGPGLVLDLSRHMHAIRELDRTQGLTVFLVEQNAYGALKLANRGYVMVNGNVTMSGTGRELLADPEVRAAYL